MNETLVRFEQHIKLGPVATARLLGYSYSTYAQYRSGLRPLQLYAARHVEAVMRLPRKTLDSMIKEHVFDV
jgi:hypothetical protein